VRYLDRAKTALIPPDHDASERDGITVEVALWWNDSYHENVLCFTNNIPQRDGGTHLAGFRGALTRRSTAMPRAPACEEGEGALTGDDCREGLTCVLSVKVPDPKFSSARPRTSWSPPKCAGGRRPGQRSSAMVRGAPGRGQDHRRQGGRGRRRPRGRPQGARTDPRKGALDMPRCPASWPTARSAIRPSPNCSSSRAIRPAARPSRAATENQAILPLRGKILNVERARFDKMLSSEEIGTLIMALGTGIGRDEFNARQAALPQDHHHDRRRRRRRHIRTLLLTFFFRRCRS
jgi:DNA gyrase subunit B